mmetsp:Transcript_5438/g.15424  ORF Transcript_5438/g.15424 Transcript_5438/m.15424 type:complete len:235 (-) Transcript_5438:4987-5691(-)
MNTSAPTPSASFAASRRPRLSSRSSLPSRKTSSTATRLCAVPRSWPSSKSQRSLGMTCSQMRMSSSKNSSRPRLTLPRAGTRFSCSISALRRKPSTISPKTSTRSPSSATGSSWSSWSSRAACAAPTPAKSRASSRSSSSCCSRLPRRCATKPHGPWSRSPLRQPQSAQPLRPTRSCSTPRATTTSSSSCSKSSWPCASTTPRSCRRCSWTSCAPSTRPTLPSAVRPWRSSWSW